MSGWDKPVGSLRGSVVSELAAKCADRIMEYTSPRAVTLDPAGKVWIERPDEVAEADLVGVYQRDQGLLLLTRDIRDDLLHEVQARGFVARRKVRPVLSEREIERRRVGL